MRSTVRLLDANANRAREAMRVMEDAARFLLDDARLTRTVKELRHRFADAVRLLGQFVHGLEQQRNTPSDVGTRISTPSERTRTDERQVVIASAKRLSEALRCLEEYGKISAPAAAGMFEQIRYEAYEVEKRLLLRLGSAQARQYRLCVIISEYLCAQLGWNDVARACLDAGADCVQLREKGLADRELLDRAIQLVELAKRYETASRPRPAVIINDRPDVAVMSQADGVHLGHDDVPADRVRAFLGGRLVIGASTHTMREARAARDFADYCGVGAIFATATKHRKPSGLAYLKQFVAKYPHQPHLAIGGITPQNVSQVIDAGARGVAVSSVVCGATKPSAVVRKLLRVIPAVKDSPMGGGGRRGLA